MYYINEKLVRGVSKLWGMTRKEFSAFAMDSAQLYAQRMTLWSRLTVNDLIKIANATHIPMRHFFVRSEKGYVPRTKEEVTFKGEWQDVSINISFIEYVYNHDEKYSREGIKKSTGMTAVAFYNWFHGNCNMRAQQACDFCNYFGCDIKNLINDPNELLPGIIDETQEDNAAPKIEDADIPPIEKRQQELEEMVKNLTRQMEAFRTEVHTAKEEVAIANAKLKVAENTKRPTLSYVCETEDEYSALYGWQSSRWNGESVPTLIHLVDHCNNAGENILYYLSKHNTTNTSDVPVTLSIERLTTLLHLAGKDTTADTLLASQFCSLINECRLTPASVLDATYLVPSFPDKLLHIIAER